MASGAIKVATGIFASRILGFLRELVTAALLGATGYADVWRFLMRAPNILQNLLGEQTLSAALIPVYSRFVAAGESGKGRRLAGAVLGFAGLAALVLAVAGIILAVPFVAVVAPGLVGDAARADGAAVDRFALAVAGVRWMFPAIGILVLSAWALAILNSHRRFLVSYTAPVFWNLAIIVALLGAARGLFGRPLSGSELVLAGAVGVLIGSALQFLVQLPGVKSSAGAIKPNWNRSTAGLGDVTRALGPLIAGRGVVQISAYLDVFLASFLTVGAMAVLGYAQVLFLLPISLLGMSMAAAELPELSQRLGTGAIDDLAPRIRYALRQTAVLAIPAAVGFVALGLPVVTLAYERGSFTAETSTVTWLALAAYSVGLVPAIASRQLQNAFIAAGQTATPARIAALRVGVAALLGVPLMLYLDRLTVPGFESGVLRMGAVGLAIGSGIAAWVEIVALRRSLARLDVSRLLPVGLWLRCLAMALVAATVALAVRLWMPPTLWPWSREAVALGCYAVAYVTGAWFLQRDELVAWLRSP